MSIRIPVEDESRIGEARRAADALAEQAGMDAESRGVLALVVSEAATNLARHARHGVAFMRALTDDPQPGVEFLAIDSGPGMSDVAQSSADGYSTGGTSGHGLGAMRRLGSEFDLYSIPGTGTALVARVMSGDAANTPVLLTSVGVICRPIDGEQACGDGWLVIGREDRTHVLVVDGLGHGPSAAAAADAARDRFRAIAELRSPRETLEAVHEVLRATRGAAVVVAEITKANAGAVVTLAGVGNITGSIVGPNGSKTLPSVNGTAGLNLRNAREFKADWSAPALLVFATDGLTTRWRLDAYPGIFHHDPAIAAACLHRDHNRGRDDVTVLVMKLNSGARS